MPIPTPFQSCSWIFYSSVTVRPRQISQIRPKQTATLERSHRPDIARHLFQRWKPNREDGGVASTVEVCGLLGEEMGGLGVWMGEQCVP